MVFRYARVVGIGGGLFLVIFIFWKFLNNGQPEAEKQRSLDDVPLVQDKVLISVYYESLCPDSVKFVRDQLWPTYNKLKDVVTIDLVPFGKATFHPNPRGKGWSFSCQHGPSECKGNKLQACAVTLFPKQAMSFVNCAMNAEYPPAAGEKCSKQAGLDWHQMSQCFDGPEGDEYLHEMGVRTKSLSPPLVFVPWININGNHTDEIQDRALTNLLGLICDYINCRNIPS